MLRLRKTSTVYVGSIPVGSGYPVVIQSMTNTLTSDVLATVNQIKELADAGSQVVRLTVDTEKAADAVPKIREKLDEAGYSVPLVGDFHFNGDQLLRQYPLCAKALAKYRINPGNVNKGGKGNEKFNFLIQKAIENNRPVRIGANWGSVDKVFLAKLMNRNQRLKLPLSFEKVIEKALIFSVLNSAKQAEKMGLAKNKIILSCKVSSVQSLISIYRKLAKSCNYPLHLGLTEAGLGHQGIVASTAALSVLLAEGIGETIRVSITPTVGQSRILEVQVAREILQALDLGCFSPKITSCPGCGRTANTFFQELALHIQTYLAKKIPKWQKYYQGVENLHVAVMGCVVNGPGESKLANIGIALPGKGENSSAQVYIDGKKMITLQGNDIAQQSEILIEEYIAKNYIKK